jgi:hypothetical protein
MNTESTKETVIDRLSLRPVLPLFVILLISLASQCGYCDTSSVKVELTTSKPEITFGQHEVPIDIKITNIGTSNLQFPDLGFMNSGSVKFAPYHIHLTTDDPAFELSLNQITGTNGPIPNTSLKPGESISKSMAMRFELGMQDKPSITFKVGFKLLENSTPTWSNPITIKRKRKKNDCENPADVEEWPNPYIFVDAKSDKVAVLRRGSSIVPEQGQGEISMNQLMPFLESLPKTTWLCGKVVAAAARSNQANLNQTLQKSKFKVIWVPSTAPEDSL